jgi:cytochrome c-type biogenesis protein CcmH/NrfF
MKSIFLLTLFLTLFIFPDDAKAGSAQTDLTESRQIAVFDSVSEKLICQCSCQMILGVCNHENCPSAIPMRKEIEKRILEGASDAQIVEEMVKTYGLKVLSSPPASGFNLAAWLMPGIALILGLAGAVFFMRTWSSRRSPSAPEPVSDNDDRRIEKELKDWEER